MSNSKSSKSLALIASIALIALSASSFLAVFPARANALQIAENQCNVTARASEVENLNYPFQSALLELISSEKIGTVPCYFRVGEEASAVVERVVYRCAPGARCPSAVVELKPGDVVSGLLSKRGEEQNPTNYLLDWRIIIPACEPLLCDLACPNGFAKDWRGCEICKCSSEPTEEKTFTVNVFEGWNFFSVPLFQERALCLPGAYCIQIFRPSPQVIASSCKASARVWWWNPLARTYNEFQLPDVSAREGIPFTSLMRGYWIKSSKNCSITFFGKTFSLNNWGDGGVKLSKGWNAVGAPSEAIAFDDIKGNCVVEKGPFAWSAAGKKYVYSPLFEPGKAYFVKVKSDCMLRQKQEVEADYCENDLDCVRQESCCDCGLGDYVNKKHYKPVLCEARCLCLQVKSEGKCVENKCVAVAVNKTGNCENDVDCYLSGDSCC